jgi:cytochrome c556
MKKIVSVLMATALGLTVVSALADVKADREAFMKENGKLVFGTLGPVAKGEQPFDAAAVAATLKAYGDHAAKFDIAALFPEGSGGEGTESLPKIWEDAAGFAKSVEDYKAVAATAAASNPADVAALQAQLDAIGKSCGACHEVYRLKKG